MFKYSIEGNVLYSEDYRKLKRTDIPDEEALYGSYQKAIEITSPRPLIVHMQQRMENYDAFNPHFLTQLRALLRASVHGKLRILFSMISCREEMVAAKIALAKARQDLSLEGVAFQEEIPLGIAIETPSAAVLSDVLAQECEYFIIDAQNLIRHALAFDLTDQQISEYEAHYNPSIFILIKCAIDGAHKCGLSCGIWGAATEDLVLIPALFSLGIDELFTSVDRIDRTSEIIGCLRIKNYEELARSLLMAGTRSEVMELLNQ